ncbi:MAG: hypothetical protein M3O61_00395 [Gemmatimonadota bacterium]|nr:hypothetical protein [Gemmatimonadota bacterium]
MAVAEGFWEGVKLRQFVHGVKQNVHDVHHFNEFQVVLRLKISQMHSNRYKSGDCAVKSVFLGAL